MTFEGDEPEPKSIEQLVEGTRICLKVLDLMIFHVEFPTLKITNYRGEETRPRVLYFSIYVSPSVVRNLL